MSLCQEQDGRSICSNENASAAGTPNHSPVPRVRRQAIGAGKSRSKLLPSLRTAPSASHFAAAGGIHPATSRHPIDAYSQGPARARRPFYSTCLNGGRDDQGRIVRGDRGMGLFFFGGAFHAQRSVSKTGSCRGLRRGAALRAAERKNPTGGRFKGVSGPRVLLAGQLPMKPR